MNTENPTLRDYLVKPFPVRAPGDDTLFADALKYAGLTIAASTEYFSDSTLDSHNQLSAFICDMVNVIYGYDQTMSEDEAIQKWLDDPDAFWNAEAAKSPNFPDYGHALPALLEYFNFELYWDDTTKETN
jgi:hypothetical protein